VIPQISKKRTNHPSNFATQDFCEDEKKELEKKRLHG